MTRAEASLLGGRTTREKYRHEHFVQVGSLGGRPRLPTLEQLKASSASKKLGGMTGSGVLISKRFNKGRAGYGK